LLISDAFGTNRATPAGELLIDLTAPHLLATSVVVSPSGTHSHAIALEPRAALLGRALHAQVLILADEPALTNAIDLAPTR